MRPAIFAKCSASYGDAEKRKCRRFRDAPNDCPIRRKTVIDGDSKRTVIPTIAASKEKGAAVSRDALFLVIDTDQKRTAAPAR